MIATGNIALWIRLLGPVTVIAHGRPVDIRAPRQRALVALLALRAGETVALDEIVAALWSSAPPRRAHSRVHRLIRDVRSRLARAGCARTVLTTEPTGYRLRLPPGARDVDRLSALVQLARRERDAGRLALAGAALQSALDLWQGPALGDVAADFARVAAGHYEQGRRAVLSDLVQVARAIGASSAIAGAPVDSLVDPVAGPVAGPADGAVVGAVGVLAET